MEKHPDVIATATVLVAALLLSRCQGCPSPKQFNTTGINSTISSPYAPSCPRRCCCNSTINLVNCSMLYQNLPIAFPLRSRTIHLDWNDMDTFDKENCSVFQQLANLSVLSATNNRLATVNKNCFKGLDKLTVLNVSYNLLSAIPSADTPYNFQTVDLSSNIISTITQNVSMPNLTRLYLDGNRITTLPSDIISGRKKLKILSLRNNGLRTIDSPGPFQGGSGLQELYLSNNELYNMPQAWLVGAFGLTVLDLRNATSKRDTTGKENWKYPGFGMGLEVLDLSLNGLRSIIHSAFDSCKSLRKIALDNNALSVLPDGLLMGLRNLTTFSAPGNLVVNISRGIWGINASLENLNLANNYIGQIDESSFRSLRMLFNLDLSGNQLVSLAFLEAPGVLEAIETLFVQNNNIAVTPNLTSLKSLRILWLQDNNLNQVPNVQRLSLLEEIDLSRNNISVVDTVSFLLTTNLKRLILQGNYIININANSLQYLPQGLIELNLADNLMECNCSLALISENLNAYQWGINLGNVTCASPTKYAGVLVSEVPKTSCRNPSIRPKSIILLALLAGIVLALIVLAVLYSKYRRIGSGNIQRRTSYQVEEKQCQLSGYEAGHLVDMNRSSGSYHNLRASHDHLGPNAVAGSSTKVNGSVIKPFEEEFYV